MRADMLRPMYDANLVKRVFVSWSVNGRMLAVVQREKSGKYLAETSQGFRVSGLASACENDSQSLENHFLFRTITLSIAYIAVVGHLYLKTIPLCLEIFPLLEHSPEWSCRLMPLHRQSHPPSI